MSFDTYLKISALFANLSWPQLQLNIKNLANCYLVKGSTHWVIPEVQYNMFLYNIG